MLRIQSVGLRSAVILEAIFEVRNQVPQEGMWKPSAHERLGLIKSCEAVFLSLR